MAFFSLQPQQTGNESNLSKFASAAPNLEHVGSSQSYLDPTGGKGETLHSPFEDPNAPNISGVRGGSGGLMQPTGTDSAAVVPTGGISPLTGTQTSGRLSQYRPQQAQPQSSLSAEQQQALQSISGVQSVLSTPGTSNLFNAIKKELVSSGQEGTYSDQQINDFITTLGSPELLTTQGKLAGSESYDPYTGYTLGADTQLNADWLNEYSPTTGARQPGATTDTSWLNKLGLSDVQGALGVTAGAISGDPAQIATSLNRVAPNVVKYITDNKDIVNQVGSVSQALGGAYSLYQGIESQNPVQITQGIASLVTGAGQTVGVNTIAQMVNVSPTVVSSALGGLGGVTGVVSLIQAIENGDPVQAILSAGSVYSALSTVAPSVFTPLTTLAADALVSVAPSVAAALGVVGSGATAAATATTGAAGYLAAEVAATGTSAVAAGTSAAVAAGAATVAWILAPFAIAMIFQAFGEGGQMINFEGRPEGWSKYVTAKRIAASQAFDAANTNSTAIQQNVQNFLADPANITPENLMAAGDQLLQGWGTYFQSNNGIGPSSHEIEPGSAAGAGWNKSIEDWRAVNSALRLAGLPGLHVPGWATSYSGLVPYGSSTDWSTLETPENQQLLNGGFMAYTAGIPTNLALQQRIIQQLTGQSVSTDQLQQLNKSLEDNTWQKQNEAEQNRLGAIAQAQQDEYMRQQMAMASPGGL